MRPVTAVACLLLVPAGCRSKPGPAPNVAATYAAELDPQAFIVELDRMAATELWPGFDLRSVPVAVFDGARTLLFRHPSPPDGFAPAPAESAWVFIGRHPAVTANNSVELGGVMTAVALLSNPATPLRERVAVVVHEAFHVYQARRHPRWVANEVELFTYPVDDPRLLALRRVETTALNRAVGASDLSESACWTRAALATRRERFAKLPAGSVEYERKSELKEGLARYVQRRAGGEGLHAADDPPPESVRDRAYESGASLAVLLDRFLPSWKAALTASDSIALDILLADAPVLSGDSPQCKLTPTERARIEAIALADVEQLHTRRADYRRQLLTQAGWRVVINAVGSPLFPQEFDPLNIHMVAPSEVLHSRYIKLGNSMGAVEVFGRNSLTEAAGAHPLFNGVRSLLVTGLAAEPLVTQADGAVTIRGEGLTADFREATAHRSGDTLIVRLGAEP